MWSLARAWLLRGGAVTSAVRDPCGSSPNPVPVETCRCGPRSACQGEATSSAEILGAGHSWRAVGEAHGCQEPSLPFRDPRKEPRPPRPSRHPPSCARVGASPRSLCLCDSSFPRPRAIWSSDPTRAAAGETHTLTLTVQGEKGKCRPDTCQGQNPLTHGRPVTPAEGCQWPLLPGPHPPALRLALRLPQGKLASQRALSSLVPPPCPAQNAS